VTEVLRAFHGEQSLKDATIERMRRHREQDTLVQGTYWSLFSEDSDRDPYFRGCAIGCLVAEDIYRERWGTRGPSALGLIGSDTMRAAFPRLLGLPAQFSVIHERIFEGLSKDEAALWPEQVLEAIPVGVDLGPWTEATWRTITDDTDEDGDLNEWWRGCRDRVLSELRAMGPTAPVATEPIEPATVQVPVTA
jgi:hypothetical protein